MRIDRSISPSVACADAYAELAAVRGRTLSCRAAPCDRRFSCPRQRRLTAGAGASSRCAAAGREIEAYRVFSEAQIGSELRKHGYRVTRTHRQFVLPIAFHKRLGSRPLTERVEGGLETIGLLRLAGSPVTVLAER
jgi:hypothetical protein